MNDSWVKSPDKIEIIELINRFGMSIDLRDWSSFRSLFVEQVKFDYSSIGEVAGILSADDIADTARQDLGGFQATQHLITNHLIEIENNTANAHAHVRAIHFLPNKAKDPVLEMGGYYSAGFTLINSHWKIKSWKFDLLWSSGDLELFELAKQIEFG
ncbi:MAG: nuclear transport factor 2 family protein [Cyanobacteria bacterium P01_A01_bin.83]